MTKIELLHQIQRIKKEQANVLVLSYTELNELPAEIGSLTDLTLLYLNHTQLTNLPAEIGNLKNLKVLALNDTQLKMLPKEIGKLTKLTKLILCDTSLKKLPTEIGKLEELRTLYLNDTDLTELPTGIGELNNLKKLDLSRTQLAKLSAEIGKLTKLTELDLSDAQLTELPAEIGELTNLKTLNLSNNRMTSLPEEIGRLANLTTLDLSDNRLTSLPAQIGQIRSLNMLDLRNNLIETPPIEIVEGGIESIRDYFRQLVIEEKEYIYEAKLLIVGEAEAGKTSLAKKIIDPNYRLKNEIKTEGIDVVSWNFQMDNERKFRVNIWDFGGQEIYHTTHQFFLSKRSLYILVADTRKEDTDFYYWCNIVALLSDDSPLLVVKNEKQDHRREINEHRLRGQFINFKETLATNLATNRGLNTILERIKHSIKDLPHIGSALPKTWIKVREILERNRHHWQNSA